MQLHSHSARQLGDRADTGSGGIFGPSVPSPLAARSGDLARVAHCGRLYVFELSRLEWARVAVGWPPRSGVRCPECLREVPLDGLRGLASVPPPARERAPQRLEADGATGASVSWWAFAWMIAGSLAAISVAQGHEHGWSPLLMLGVGTYALVAAGSGVMAWREWRREAAQEREARRQGLDREDAP